MVRTKADSSSFKAGAKAPRKAMATTAPTYSSGDSSAGKSSFGGGNSYHPRETPEWQKPITSFFASPSTKVTSSNTGKSEERTESSNAGPSHQN